MRIFRYIQLCFLLLSIGVFTSCFDDEGNYEYKEIGEAVIKSIPGVTDHGNKFVCLENEKNFIDTRSRIFSWYYSS